MSLSHKRGNLQKIISEMTEALILAEKAMNYMGDKMNGIDAVSPEDVAATQDAFYAVRAAIAKATQS